MGLRPVLAALTATPGVEELSGVGRKRMRREGEPSSTAEPMGGPGVCAASPHPVERRQSQLQGPTDDSAGVAKCKERG